MFEIGDIVRFRHWSDKLWEEGTFIIIDVELSHQSYDDSFYSYTIQNQETGKVITPVSWQQIELI